MWLPGSAQIERALTLQQLHTWRLSHVLTRPETGSNEGPSAEAKVIMARRLIPMKRNVDRNIVDDYLQGVFAVRSSAPVCVV